MKVNGSKAFITKDYILEKITEEEIFEKYLGYKPNLSQEFVNPIRSDKHSGCRFFLTHSGRLKFNDFSKGVVYDCFDMVQKKYEISFSDAVRKIAYDFKLIDIKDPVTTQPAKFIASKKLVPTIKVEIRDFADEEKEFWQEFGVCGLILRRFGVYAIKRADFIKGKYRKVLYIHKNKEMAFGYFSCGEWQLYFPNRKKRRFVNISQNILMGYDLLPSRGKDLVITKSYKDVICLYTFKVHAVAPSSETARLSKSKMEELFKRFENIYILYDNDMPGKRAMIKRCREYPKLIPILFPNGFPKDVSDNVKYGKRDFIESKIKLLRNEHSI